MSEADEEVRGEVGWAKVDCGVRWRKTLGQGRLLSASKWDSSEAKVVTMVDLPPVCLRCAGQTLR